MDFLCKDRHNDKMSNISNMDTRCEGRNEGESLHIWLERMDKENNIDVIRAWHDGQPDRVAYLKFHIAMTEPVFGKWNYTHAEETDPKPMLSASFGFKSAGSLEAFGKKEEGTHFRVSERTACPKDFLKNLESEIKSYYLTRCEDADGDSSHMKTSFDDALKDFNNLLQARVKLNLEKLKKADGTALRVALIPAFYHIFNCSQEEIDRLKNDSMKTMSEAEQVKRSVALLEKEVHPNYEQFKRWTALWNDDAPIVKWLSKRKCQVVPFLTHGSHKNSPVMMMVVMVYSPDV